MRILSSSLLLALVLAGPAAAQGSIPPFDYSTYAIAGEIAGGPIPTGPCVFEETTRAAALAGRGGTCGTASVADPGHGGATSARVERDGSLHASARAWGNVPGAEASTLGATVIATARFEDELFLVPRPGATHAYRVVFDLFLEGSVWGEGTNGGWPGGIGLLSGGVYGHQTLITLGPGSDPAVRSETRRIEYAIASYDPFRPPQVHGMWVNLLVEAVASGYAFEAEDPGAPATFQTTIDFAATGGIVPGSMRVLDIAGADITSQWEMRFSGQPAITAAPEPATLALVGLGLGVLAAGVRRRHHAPETT